jgi:hypothetical protein
MALAVYSEMQSNTEVEMDVVTYTSVIDACARAGRRDQALQVFAFVV